MPRPRTLLFVVLTIVALILFARSTSNTDKSFYDNTVEALRLKQEEGQHKMGTAAVKDAKLREANEQVKIEVQQEAEERRKKESGESVADQSGHKHPVHAAADKEAAAGEAQKIMGGVEEDVVAGKTKEGKPHEVGTSRGKWTNDDAAKADVRPEKSEHDQRMDAVLEDILKRGPVTIFSKTYCPYSKKAKAVFAKYSITPEPVIVEIDRHELGNELQDKLLETTGRRTVPNILINGKSIGGGDDVADLHEKGELLKLIREMGGKRIMEAKLRG